MAGMIDTHTDRKIRALENAVHDATQALLRAKRARARINQIHLNADQAVLVDDAWDHLDKALKELRLAIAPLREAEKIAKQ